jgi:hypothetical protein
MDELLSQIAHETIVQSESILHVSPSPAIIMLTYYNTRALLQILLQISMFCLILGHTYTVKFISQIYSLTGRRRPQESLFEQAGTLVEPTTVHKLVTSWKNSNT